MEIKYALKVTILSLLFASTSYGAKSKLYTPDWKNLNLDSYLKLSNKNVEIKSLDPNKVGKNTFFIISTKNSDGKSVLDKQLFDFDQDGKIDLVKHFDTGKLKRSEWNLDHDDVVDTVKLHKLEDGSVYLKVENDGKMNIWSHYYKGELRRQEFDRNNDNVIDMWYYFRGGEIYKAQAAKKFNPKKVEDITKAVIK